MAKITWTDRTDIGIPTGDTTEMAAASFNEIKTVVNANDDAKLDKSDYNDHTILQATLDNTPVAITVAEQRLLGRITGGDISALTDAEVLGLLGLATIDSPNFKELSLGIKPALSKLHIELEVSDGGKAWQVRDKNGVLRYHFVAEGDEGINGMGLFDTYLSFQTSEASLDPQCIFRQYSDHFRIEAVNSGDINKLSLYADGEIWLWPKKNGFGNAAVYMILGELSPFTDLRAGVTLGSAAKRWGKFYSKNITDDGNSNIAIAGSLTQSELSADPANPAEGKNVTWQSDGTGSGDDGDIMMKITAGGVTKIITKVDFSAS